MLSRSETRFQDWLFSFLLLVWYGYQAIMFVEAGSAAPSVYMSLMPVWASSGEAVGVWTGVAGAVLLVLGSRMALLGFVASLVGAGAYASYTHFIQPMPGLEELDFVLMAAKMGVGLLAVMYTNALSDRRVLR